MEPKELLELRAAVERLERENQALRAARPLEPEEFSRLLAVSQLVVSELDLATVFELVAANARELVRADQVVVPMLNPARDEYTYVAAAGLDADEVRGTTFPTRVGMCGWVLRNQRSLLFGAASDHWMDEKTTWEEGQSSAVLVPLIGRLGILGGLSALGKQGGGSFTQHDLDLLTMFANHVSVAIENAQLFQQVMREVEDRTQAEVDLQESRSLLAQILDAMPQAVFWKDRARVYLGCNRVFARALGFDDPAQVVGRTDLDLHWPRAEAEAYRRDDEEVMSAKRAKLHLTEPLQQADGGRLWIDTSKVPLLDREGAVLGVLGVYEDITARKQASEALQRSERRLRESQRVARLGSWELDLVERQLDWSEETYELFDERPGRFVPSFDEFERRVHPDDLQGFRAAFAGALASDEHPFHAVLRIENATGRSWVMEAAGAVRRGEGGEAVRIYGTAQDVTERERAEARLRQNEQFIRNILDAVDEGFIVVGRDYRIISANSSYCRQVGRERDAVLGKGCFELSHRRDRPCWAAGEECAVRHVFATGEPFSFAHKHADATGAEVFIETKAYPLKDAAGEVVSVIETVSDTTQRHLLEEERLKAQKLESIGTLAGGIAHDFNNLLQGVFGSIAMARLAWDRGESGAAMLDQTEVALRQAIGLTNQLLTFAKGGKPVRRPTDLRGVIESATRFALSGSHVGANVDVARDLWRVEADEGQVAQVIQNIVLNAEQAMPTQGSILVAARNVPVGTAELPRGLPRGDYVAISVRDSGSGIPRRILDKIFDPYFTTKARGSGLGLATSYSIVRNHAGAIDVQSKEGEGSTFTVYLPALVAERPPVPASAATAPSPTPGARVLVMDDEQLLRSVARRMIRALGHEVDVAVDGREALEKYGRAMTAGRPFDVVILDLTIRGGMGGVETIAKLRALDPSVKAIVSSGYSEDASMADPLRHGFQAFLRKPYGPAELREALAAVLRPGR